MSVASFFRRLAENWKLKTLAFILAVLLWVVLSLEQVVSNWVPVPLEVQLIDPDYQLLPPAVGVVEVRLSGPARDLLDVAVRRPPLRLMVDNVVSESGTYELNPRMIQLGGQFTVNALDVRPATVELSFARVDSRLIPVRVRLNNLLGLDWALVDSLTPDPSVVRLTGPPARVAATTEIFTEVVGVIPEDTLFERVVALDTTGFEGLGLSARSVRVVGRLDRVVERGLPQVPVSIGPGIRVEPDRVYVLLQGINRTVQGIAPASFRVVVAIDQIPDLPEDGLLVPLRVDGLPARVQATIEPGEVLLLPGPAVGDAAEQIAPDSPPDASQPGPG